MASELQKAIVAALSDKEIVNRIVETLMEALMPKILQHLKELNVFNGEFCEEFSAYKKQQEVNSRKERNEIARKLDQLEQYERLDCVRVFGVEEHGDEDTADIVSKFFTKELKVKISKNDLNIAHRLGASSDDGERKPRPIIVKFLRREQRLQVLRARTALKGRKSLAVCPDLT